jgi:hypothetical protein
MNADALRRARTESLFRDVNEGIAEKAERFEADGTQFVCECSDPGCTHRVHASLEEYAEVRADGTHFLITPGHAQFDLERVVADRGRFQIVEKVNRTARRLVRRLDPRAAGN